MPVARSSALLDGAVLHELPVGSEYAARYATPEAAEPRAPTRLDAALRAASVAYVRVGPCACARAALRRRRTHPAHRRYAGGRYAPARTYGRYGTAVAWRTCQHSEPPAIGECLGHVRWRRGRRGLEELAVVLVERVAKPRRQEGGDHARDNPADALVRVHEGLRIADAEEVRGGRYGMLRRLLHGRLWLSRRAALARGAEPRVLQSRPQERASQQPHPRAVSLRVGALVGASPLARRRLAGRGLVMRTAIKMEPSTM